MQTGQKRGENKQNIISGLKTDMRKWIGYHYTSLQNWREIQKSGFLIPQVVKKEELDWHFVDQEIRGVWVWVSRPKGVSHMGALIYQVAQKQDTQVVRLKICFPHELDILRKDERIIELIHKGTIGNWVYHKNDSAYVWKTKIPVSWVRNVKVYNLVSLLR